MQKDWFQQRLTSSLENLAQIHQCRVRRDVTAISTTESLVDGRLCCSFATNDYLGLTRHPKVIEAFSEAATRQAGSGASALIAGRSSLHHELEASIARFESTESALLFPSGFAANLGTLKSLIRAGDAVFCDRDNHASLIDGCRSSAGKFYVYDRHDLDRLAESFERRRTEFEAAFIVTDSVFSMDGSLADLPRLCDLADQWNAAVIVDEAHGTGVFGETGRGVCERQQVEDRVTVRIGTLSKAIGGLGGFVAGSTELCDWLWNTARSQFFSTALPPAVCAAALASLRVIDEEPQRRRLVADRSIFTRRLLRQENLRVIFDESSPMESPIIAVLIGDDDLAVRISQQMLGKGFFIPAVRPPTVASGTARLRMSISSDHSEQQIQSAVYQLRDVLYSARR